MRALERKSYYPLSGCFNLTNFKRPEAVKLHSLFQNKQRSEKSWKNEQRVNITFLVDCDETIFFNISFNNMDVT